MDNIIEKTIETLNIHDLATQKLTTREKWYYYKKHATIKPFYEFWGFTNLLFAIKIPMSEILTRKKCNRGGRRKITKQRILTQYEKIRIEELYSQGYSYAYIYKATNVTPYSQQKHYKAIWIYREHIFFTTNQQRLDYKTNSDVKWNLAKYRQFKREGLSDEEIDKIRKKNPWGNGFKKINY